MLVVYDDTATRELVIEEDLVQKLLQRCLELVRSE